MRARFNAIILAGGQAVRLDGADKASVEVGGRTLLALAVAAVEDAEDVAVAGDPAPVERSVTFVREDPRHGGPVAALYAGYDALATSSPWVLVLACDMPLLGPETVARLMGGAAGHDGSVLVGPDGRRHLAVALATPALERVRPPRGEEHGAALWPLLRDLDLAEVAAVHDEHRDVDTWSDLLDLRDLDSADLDSADLDPGDPER